MGVRASISLGKVTVRTAAQNRLIETARLMPTSALESSAFMSSSEGSIGVSRDLTTMKEWERLSGVGERYWSFARRIKGSKEIYE